MRIRLSQEPIIITRPIGFDDTKEEMKQKNKKQFTIMNTCILSVYLDDREFTITAWQGYCFDGATIPFGLGKGNMKFQIPALYHDIMCEKKYLVNNDRNLSSKIFKELLLLCGVPKWKAQLMYLAVDNYQKLCGWEKSN